MDEAKSNYTDEEIYVLAELQLGKPPATKNPARVGRPVNPSAEGQYYNDLTEFLFRVCGFDLLRMRALRVGFYDRHSIMAVDMVKDVSADLFVRHNKDGSMTFLSEDFDKSKLLR